MSTATRPSLEHDEMEGATNNSDIEIEDTTTDDEESQEGSKGEKVGQETFAAAAAAAAAAASANKLGFSIAQIMGFMGKKKSKDEKEKSHCGDDLVASSHEEEKNLAVVKNVAASTATQFPAPPKLWRPQPFRDFNVNPSPK